MRPPSAASEPSPPRWAARLLPLLAPVAALGGVLATGAAVAPQLGDPGVVVRWGIPVVTAAADLGMALALGALAVSLLAGPGVHRPALVLAGRAATEWAGAMVVLIVLVSADVAGVGLSDSSLAGHVWSFVTRVDRGIGALVTVMAAAGAAVAAVIAARAQTVRAAGAAALLALVGVLGAAPAGHVATVADQQTAVAGRALHLIGMSAWVGGLLALVLLWPSLWRERVAASAARGFSAMAGWSYLVVAASGVMNGYAVLGAWSGLRSAYGLLLVAKAAVLVVLGLAGAWHRRYSLSRLDRAGSRAFLRMAVGEVALMSLAVGLAVALADTAPPLH